MRSTDRIGLRWWAGLSLLASLAVAGVPAGAQQLPPSPNLPQAPSLSKPPKLPTSPRFIESPSAALDLSVDGNRTVGGGIVVTFAVMAHRPLESVQIEIILPDGMQKTAGEPVWRGPIATGEVRIVEVSAELSTPGTKRIIGRVTIPPTTANGTPQVVTAEREWEVEKEQGTKPTQ
ncbi:MAG TPA: hypothetical protein VEI24_07210 [Nitrospiria bacterium]|nr:hypothetical protein [Nitrospiria bacterium]